MLRALGKSLPYWRRFNYWDKETSDKIEQICYLCHIECICRKLGFFTCHLCEQIILFQKISSKDIFICLFGILYDIFSLDFYQKDLFYSYWDKSANKPLYNWMDETKSNLKIKTIIPCFHKNIKSCTCLSEEQKNNKNIIYRYHWMGFICTTTDHSLLPPGYIIVNKPTWKQNCFFSYEDKYHWTQKFEKITLLAGLICQCTTLQVCPLCATFSNVFLLDIKQKAQRPEKETLIWYNFFYHLNDYPIYEHSWNKKQNETSVEIFDPENC